MTGEVIGGRYRLDRRLGVGAMSEVWAGHDLELDRAVAVKFLGEATDPLRFEREAQTDSKLADFGIARLGDASQLRRGRPERRPLPSRSFHDGGGDERWSSSPTRAPPIRSATTSRCSRTQMIRPTHGCQAGHETIDVYLDPEHANRYLVDTSFLPESEADSVRPPP